MNDDIIDSFIGAYKSGALDNYQEKNSPRKIDQFYHEKTDLESFQTPSTDKTNTQMPQNQWNNLMSRFSSAN